jgi:hypothetical protein
MPAAGCRLQLSRKAAARLLTVLLSVVTVRTEADSRTQNPSLDLLEQLIGPCCTTGAPSLLWLPLMPEGIRYHQQRVPAVQHTCTHACQHLMCVCAVTSNRSYASEASKQDILLLHARTRDEYGLRTGVFVLHHVHVVRVLF